MSIKEKIIYTTISFSKGKDNCKDTEILNEVVVIMMG